MTERPFEELNSVAWGYTFESIFADGSCYRLPAGTILTAHRTKRLEEASASSSLHWDFTDEAGKVIFRMIPGEAEPLIMRVRPYGDTFSDLSVEDFTRLP